MSEENALTEEIVNQYVIYRQYSCEVCYNDFKENTLRMQKVRFVSSDDDLHPCYTPVDPLLYDVIICPHCGYAAMTMFWGKISSKQREEIKKNIKPAQPARQWSRVMTYKEAAERYNSALLTANAKGAKHSEIGYIYMKLAWLSRLMQNPGGYKIYAARSLKEFEEAYEKEDFPICQMDEPTFEYLLAYLCFLSGKSDEAMRWLGRVITNVAANNRVKEKSRDLKETIQNSK